MIFIIFIIYILNFLNWAYLLFNQYQNLVFLFILCITRIHFYFILVFPPYLKFNFENFVFFEDPIFIINKLIIIMNKFIIIIFNLIFVIHVFTVIFPIFRINLLTFTSFGYLSCQICFNFLWLYLRSIYFRCF